ENRDGGNNNCSYNYGGEGPSIDPVLESIRERQLKNFFATLMVSLGTPMILGGDEIARTQNGNNTAYCQDNGISWYAWTLLEKNRGLYRFVKEMISFRLRHPGFMRPEFYTGRDGNYNAIPDISWFNEKGVAPDWDKIGYCLALQINGRRADVLRDKDDADFFIMFNAGLDPVVFYVTAAGDRKTWFRAVDTSFNSPNDILPAGTEAVLPNQHKYTVKARSMAILISKSAQGTAV
ncbi:MAG: glycogen debranching enzyme, partial [Treponema sp.]|nr:glycogen debranching enzyme [Treponema sp.]